MLEFFTSLAAPKPDPIGENFERLEYLLREKEWERSILKLLINSTDIDYIYTADMETHQVVYMNDPLKELVEGDPTQQKCYELFQGQFFPCEFCNSKLLKDSLNKPFSWVFKNEKFNKVFLITDIGVKVDSRFLRIEKARDITPFIQTIKQF